MNRIKYIKKNRIQERMKDKEGDEWIANQNLSAVELLTNSLRYTWRTEEKSLYYKNNLFYWQEKRNASNNSLSNKKT